MNKARNNIAEARRAYSAREGIRYTQEKAAHDFGLTIGTLRNYEQEKTLPQVSTLMAMSNKYGVSIAYLLGETDDPHQNISSLSLTDNEKALIRSYRMCDANGKAAIKAAADGIANVFMQRG